MNWCPIQDVFHSHTQCSQDSASTKSLTSIKRLLNMNKCYYKYIKKNYRYQKLRVEQNCIDFIFGQTISLSDPLHQTICSDV